MIRLPDRHAISDTPIPRNDRVGGDLLPSEESASFLLWAWPHLLGWPRPINWLFSPVVGNRIYPGDLWGVDSRGDLLVIETKIDRTRWLQDPFGDFVAYGSGPPKKVWQAGSLRQHWLNLVTKEEEFIRNHAESLTPDFRPNGTYPGVLPYSSHRNAVWRWQSVFLKRVIPKFLNGSYRDAVGRSLEKRADRKNPPPIFFGLIAVIRQIDPKLSQKGRMAFSLLYRLLGRDRVGLRAIRADRLGGQRMRIKCWTVVSEQEAARAMAP
jgi:hypothetical protein